MERSCGLALAARRALLLPRAPRSFAQTHQADAQQACEAGMLKA